MRRQAKRKRRYNRKSLDFYWRYDGTFVFANNGYKVFEGKSDQVEKFMKDGELDIANFTVHCNEIFMKKEPELFRKLCV